MNIIEEMRTTAATIRLSYPGEVDLNADAMERWADMLESNTVLVPVPDGEPCRVDELRHTQLVLWDGLVWVADPGMRYLVRDQEKRRVSLPFDTTVQPVRLVPIAEADL